MLGSLDYLYIPAPDMEVSLQYYTRVLGGQVQWKVQKYGAWVACVKIAATGPCLLLADHLHQRKPVLIYQVTDIEKAARELRARGWLQADGPFEIPNGPCYTFQDPAGMRLAIYENLRPHVFDDGANVQGSDLKDAEVPNRTETG